MLCIITVTNHASNESHMTTEASSTKLCEDTPVLQPQTSTVADTVSMTPQSTCSCSNQQQTSTSSSSDSDVVTICVPVVVIFGVIILTALVVIGLLIWRKMKSGSDEHLYDRVTPRTTAKENDLSRLVATTYRCT